MLPVDGSGNGTILKIKGVFSMEQAPECWGKFDQCGRKCEFAAACRLCTETESRIDRPVGGQDFDSVTEWAPDLADRTLFSKKTQCCRDCGQHVSDAVLRC